MPEAITPPRRTPVDGCRRGSVTPLSTPALPVREAGRGGGRLVGMNTARPDGSLPDDASTTGGGEGWSEDMELAPAHPGERDDDAAADDERQGERLQKVLARAGVASRRVVE